MNDTKKKISECIVKIIQTKLSKFSIKCGVIKMLLKCTYFAHPMLNINSDTKSPDIQIVSILIHLLCMIIFKGEAGNCWYDILTGLRKNGISLFTWKCWRPNKGKLHRPLKVLQSL